MKYLLLMMMTLNLGCIKQVSDSPHILDRLDQTHNSVFNQYIDEFEHYTELKTSSKIRFLKESESFEEGTLAVCVGGRGLIIIDKVLWVKLPEVGKQVLITHELGHCELGLGHVDDPTNVMYPSLTASQLNLYNLDPVSTLETMVEEN